jgi:hypothetical protein
MVDGTVIETPVIARPTRTGTFFTTFVSPTAVTVIDADPDFIATTLPLESTVATAGVEELQVMDE